MNPCIFLTALPVILVTEPTPFGLSDLKIAIKTMERLELDYGVVINKSMTGKDPVRKYCLQNDDNAT